MIAHANYPNQKLLAEATRKRSNYKDPREKKSMEIAINDLRNVKGDEFHKYMSATYRKMPPADNIVDLMNFLYLHNKVERLPRFAKKSYSILKVAMQKQWHIIKDIFPGRVFFINMKKFKINPSNEPIDLNQRNEIYLNACNELMANIDPEVVAMKIARFEHEKLSYATLFKNDTWAGIITYSRIGPKNKILHKFFVDMPAPQIGITYEQSSNFEINQMPQLIESPLEYQIFSDFQIDFDDDDTFFDTFCF